MNWLSWVKKVIAGLALIDPQAVRHFDFRILQSQKTDGSRKESANLSEFGYLFRSLIRVRF